MHRSANAGGNNQYTTAAEPHSVGDQLRRLEVATSSTLTLPVDDAATWANSGGSVFRVDQVGGHRVAENSECQRWRIAHRC